MASTRSSVYSATSPRYAPTLGARGQGQVSDALVLSLGYHGSYVLPVYNARHSATHAKRIDVGGLQLTEFMLRLLLCRHVPLRSHFSFARARVRFAALALPIGTMLALIFL